LELLRWRPCGPEEDNPLVARGLEDFEIGELAFPLVEVEGRDDKSTEGRGVEASENARDFRLAGGKKPSARRGSRPISVGSVSLGNRTHESCVHGVSESVFDCEEDGIGGMLLFVPLLEPHPLGSDLELVLVLSALSQ